MATGPNESIIVGTPVAAGLLEALAPMSNFELFEVHYAKPGASLVGVVSGTYIADADSETKAANGWPSDGFVGAVRVSRVAKTEDTYLTVFEASNGAFKTGNDAWTQGASAASADKLTTARTISLTGAVTGSATFDGSSNINIVTTAS